MCQGQSVLSALQACIITYGKRCVTRAAVDYKHVHALFAWTQIYSRDNAAATVAFCSVFAFADGRCIFMCAL